MPAKTAARAFARKPRGARAAPKRVAPPARTKGRQVPRPFAFHWGGGNIIEEASFAGEHTEPAIQLLEYEGHPGSYGIRFCYYSLDGRFQRSPMMIDSGTNLEGLRAALRNTPKLRALLRRLAS
jgi:hypothetical protein